MKIIFVCHDNASIEMVYDIVINSEQMFIIFVGDKLIKNEYLIHPKIIIAKNYENNIESTKKLLTFTAWYLIVNNRLFFHEDYLCILEYDVMFNHAFLEKLNENYNKYDIVSFQSQNTNFEADVSMTQMTNYLSHHNLPTIETWWPTTNHCIRRDLLVEFVNFYYYTYKDIDDEINLSFYHERIFSCYTKQLNRWILNGLNHLGSYSHRRFHYKTYLLCYDTNKDLTDKLICSINTYNPDMQVIRCNPMDINHILWKPIIIYKILDSLEPNESLLYLDNTHKISKEFDDLYLNYSYIKVWNYPNRTLNPIILHEMISIFNVNVEETIPLLKTDIILFENKPFTIIIVKQWLDICIHFLNDKKYINMEYIDTIFSLLIFMYKN